jgi:hypothetical protein
MQRCSLRCTVCSVGLGKVLLRLTGQDCRTFVRFDMLLHNGGVGRGTVLTCSISLVISKSACKACLILHCGRMDSCWIG